jgi:anti-sigma factor RsiW
MTRSGESEHNESLLLEYCAGRLDPGAAAALERHMEACAACRDFQRRQALVWSALGEWEAALVSAGFDRRLRARIDADAPARWWSRLTAQLRWNPAIPLAAACLTLAALALFDVSPEAPLTVVPSAQVEMVQMDQAERTLEDLEMLRQFDFVTAASGESPGS